MFLLSVHALLLLEGNGLRAVSNQKGRVIRSLMRVKTGEQSQMQSYDRRGIKNNELNIWKVIMIKSIGYKARLDCLGSNPGSSNY